jgi:hypothetical protein
VAQKSPAGAQESALTQRAARHAPNFARTRCIAAIGPHPDGKLSSSEADIKSGTSQNLLDEIIKQMDGRSAHARQHRSGIGRQV